VRLEAKRRALDEIAARQRAADQKRKEEAERRQQAAMVSQSTGVLFTRLQLRAGELVRVDLCVLIESRQRSKDVIGHIATIAHGRSAKARRLLNFTSPRGPQGPPIAGIIGFFYV
jgi:hypothetical protein